MHCISLIHKRTAAFAVARLQNELIYIDNILEYQIIIQKRSNLCADPLVKGLLFSHESIEKKMSKSLLIYDLSKPVIRSAQGFFYFFPKKSLRERQSSAVTVLRPGTLVPFFVKTCRKHVLSTARDRLQMQTQDSTRRII